MQPQWNREHDSGMERCFWRSNDLLEEEDHTAKAHAAGFEDDECYYTKANKIPYHPNTPSMRVTNRI